MEKDKLNKKKLQLLISESIKKVLKEYKTLDVINFKNHILEVRNYDMSINDDKEFIVKHKKEIWNILENGYEKLGGFHGFQGKSDMIKKTPLFRLGYCDGELVTVTVYNDYLGGLKCVSATCVKDEKHTLAVKLLDMIIRYNIIHWDEWFWIEASGKIEEMCKKKQWF